MWVQRRSRPTSRERMTSSNARVMRNLILGIDPGLSTGIAATDLGSKIILLTSIRECSKPQVISLASSCGTVVMVATDRVKVPRFVVDVARTLGAQIFTQTVEPTYEGKLVEVTQFTTSMELKPKDEHQVAALFAVAKALKAYKNLFEEAERALDEELVSHRVTVLEQVKLQLLRGVSIKRALRSTLLEPAVLSNGSDRAPETLRRELTAANRKISELNLLLKRASTARAPSRRAVVSRDKTVIVPSEDAEYVRKELEETKDELQSLKNRLSIQPKTTMEGYVKLKMVGIYERSRIRDMAAEGLISRGDVTYGYKVRGDPAKVGLALKDAGVDAAIVEDENEASLLEMIRSNVLAIPGSTLAIVWSGFDAFLSKDKLEEALRYAKSKYKDLLLRFIADYSN